MITAGVSWTLACRDCLTKRPFDETRPTPTRQPVMAGRFRSRELVLKSKSHNWPTRREFVRLSHAAHRPRLRLRKAHVGFPAMNRPGTAISLVLSGEGRSR